MSDKDNDLDSILKPMKETSPNDFQMQKWQMAVRKELRKNNTRSTTRTKWALQLVAAMLVGIMLGAVLFRKTEQQAVPTVAQISFDDATFEHSHDNLN